MNATMNVNNELNGIEISFASKPAQDILSTLKENGFRWSKYKKVWYTKQSEKAFEVAESVTNGDVTEVKAVPKTTKKKQSSFNLWNATQWEEIQVDNNKETKEISKEIRQHLKKRFPSVKFSVRTDKSGWTDSVNVDIKSSPYEEGSVYLKAVIEYADQLVNAYHICHDPGDMYTDLSASYNFYFFGASTHYTYEQTEATDAIKKDMVNFDQKLKEAEKIEEERKEQEFKEWQRQREEEKKEYEKRMEEEAKQTEHIYSNVSVNSLNEDDQYYIVGVEFANLNKQCTLSRYKEEVSSGDYSSHNVKITKDLNFTSIEAFENFSNMLMNPFDFLANTGGSYTEDKRFSSMTDFYNMELEERNDVQWIKKGVAVYFNNELQFVIDAQGHDYARYVGLTNNATVQKDIEIKETITNEELEELQYQAAVIEDASTQVVSDLKIIDTWQKEDWSQYKDAMKAKLKEYKILPTKAIVQQIEFESLKIAMYKILQEVDGIQDQFTEAEIQQGEKVTLFYISDFGSIVTSRITFDSVENKKYAQYENAVKLTFKPEGKRKLYYSHFYSDILVYKGWHKLPDNVLNDITAENGMVITRSKYHSCDKKQYDEILNYFTNKDIKPVINTYKPMF
ncbi:LPD29 domain-containing protein [Halobacillus litoralis]|uniref:LPD29 domain-containing protein n=1 Tax=Halobacillus litoralis TaxID=45668 RepID=UPI001CD2DEE3|nr:LPD29 domain-containing protein [Halobacillus litoralis]MCA1021604.1 hypothetical protein [Halobacillus litoralis]